MSEVERCEFHHDWELCTKCMDEDELQYRAELIAELNAHYDTQSTPLSSAEITALLDDYFAEPCEDMW